MPEIIEPVPGDPTTEPVATAEQSHVAGRVGPATIAEDAAAVEHAPEGVAQVKPGEYAGPPPRPAKHSAAKDS